MPVSSSVLGDLTYRSDSTPATGEYAAPVALERSLWQRERVRQYLVAESLAEFRCQLCLYSSEALFCKIALKSQGPLAL